MKPHKVNSVETTGTPDDSSDKEGSGLVANHALSAENISSNTYWIVDSGATSHICNDRTQFVHLYPLKHSVEVKLGDGRIIMATAQGDISLRMKYGSNKSCKRTLYNVLYVPELSYNLVSVSKAVEKENTVKFSDFGCTIRDKKRRPVAVGTKVGGLYRVDVIHSVDVNTVEMNNHHPLTKEDLSGSEYFLTFVDNKSRYVWVYILKRKSDVFKRFCEWKAMVELSTGKKSSKHFKVTMVENIHQQNFRTIYKRKELDIN